MPPLSPDYQEDGMAGTAEVFGAFVIPMTPLGRRRRVVFAVFAKVVDQLVVVEQLPILVVRFLLERRSRSRVTTGGIVVGSGGRGDDADGRRRREERGGEVRNDE